jgi:hypothetical protein
MQMFYDLYYGKTKETIKEQYKNNIQISFIEEKKILRLISYYKQIKKDLTKINLFKIVEIKIVKPTIVPYLYTISIRLV